jgi:hypothetical protein
MACLNEPPDLYVYGDRPPSPVSCNPRRLVQYGLILSFDLIRRFKVAYYYCPLVTVVEVSTAAASISGGVPDVPTG